MLLGPEDPADPELFWWGVEGVDLITPAAVVVAAVVVALVVIVSSFNGLGHPVES